MIAMIDEPTVAHAHGIFVDKECSSSFHTEENTDDINEVICPVKFFHTN